MNTKSIAIAIALVAGTAAVSPAQALSPITTLETVQVRPAADQIAQQAWEQASDIRTLAAVQVRPDAAQMAERQQLQARTAVAPITTLAAVNVRPSLDQWVALAAEQQAERYTAALAAAATTFAGHVIVNLPAVHVRPSQADLQALAIETAAVLVRP